MGSGEKNILGDHVHTPGEPTSGLLGMAFVSKRVSEQTLAS